MSVVWFKPLGSPHWTPTSVRRNHAEGRRIRIEHTSRPAPRTRRVAAARGTRQTQAQLQFSTGQPWIGRNEGKKAQLGLPDRPLCRAKVEAGVAAELRRVAYESRCMSQERVFVLHHSLNGLDSIGKQRLLWRSRRHSYVVLSNVDR